MIKQSVLGHECLGTVNSNQSQVTTEVTDSAGPADHLVDQFSHAMAYATAQ